MLTYIHTIYEQLKYKCMYTIDNLPNTTGKIAEELIITMIEDAFQKEGLETLFKTQNKKYKPKYSKNKYNLLNSASVPILLEERRKNTGIFNAIIQGGRTYNERWETYHLETIFYFIYFLQH